MASAINLYLASPLVIDNDIPEMPTTSNEAMHRAATVDESKSEDDENKSVDAVDAVDAVAVVVDGSEESSVTETEYEADSSFESYGGQGLTQELNF